MTRPPPTLGRLLLWTGPAGSGKTHRVLERIREAATAEGPRGRGAAGADDALLVLPTYAQVNHARRVALSRWEARGIFDAPFATFTGAGERFLPEFRVRALPSAEERDRLMEEALRRAAVPVFEEVADRAGFRERLLRLVKEAKQTGLAAEAVRAGLARAAPALAPGPRERLEGFLQVLGAYEALLAAAGLEDHEDALRRLLVALGTGSGLRASRIPRLLAVDGFDDFTAVEEGILHALAAAVARRGGEVLVTLPWDVERSALFPGARVARERLLARGFREERLEGFARAPGGALARIAAGLFASPGTPVPAGSEVEALAAGDPADEAEAVARIVRRVARDGPGDGGPPLRGWRDVAVVVRSVVESAPRLEAAFDRLGVPLRLVGGGRPLAAEALVRSLEGPLQVLGGGVDAGTFDPPALGTWLRWCAHAGRDEDLLRAVDAAEISWRREGWPPDLASFLDRAPAAARPHLEALDARREALSALRGAAAVYPALAEALAACAPLLAPGGLDAEGRPLDPAHDGRAARAAAAFARLQDLVQGMGRAARRTGLGLEVTAAEAVGEVREAVDRATFALPDPRLDAVSLLDAEEARFWEAPVVVVAGLAEGEFPRRPREDPILLDEDRERIRDVQPPLGLPLARDREARERRLFLGALTRARRLLVLVRAAHDEDGGPREPSPFLRDFARVVEVPWPPARRPGRVAPAMAECFTRRDLSLFAAAACHRPLPAGDRPLARALLHLAGDTALERAMRWVRRAADPLPEGPGLPDPFARSVEVVSATTLNHAVACLHRHFLRSVARIPRDEVPLEGPKVDALAVGRLLHDALRIAVAQPGKPPAAVAAEVLEGQEISPLARDLAAREIARVVTLWRDRESRAAGSFAPAPGGLEWSFGRCAPEDPEPEVVLGEGEERVSLFGRVDRVDVAGDLAIVMDYKTSPAGAERGRKEAEAGVDLQLPLYAAAVEQRLGRRVAGLEWVAIRRRLREGLWGEVPDPALLERRDEGDPATPDASLLRSLRAAAEEAARGAVKAVRAARHGKQEIDPARCDGCAWRAVCRPDRAFLRRRAAGDP